MLLQIASRLSLIRARVSFSGHVGRVVCLPNFSSPLFPRTHNPLHLEK